MNSSPTPVIVTTARTDGCGSRISTTTSTSPLSTSGVNRTAWTPQYGTSSIQTVCQMPVTGVYQMPCGLRICLPTGCDPESVGSHTQTTSSWSPVGFSALEMSNVNGSYPPLCSPTTVPLTVTLQCQSTAP